jgi:hypothetical protein
VDGVSDTRNIASAQQPRTLRSPTSVPARSVDVGFDGWVFPKSGVAFVWVLTSEVEALAERVSRS